MTLRLALVASVPIALAVACGASEPAGPFRVVGVWHAVSEGDTIDSIAKEHGADPEVVAELNDLPVERGVTGRSEVFVPLAEGDPPGSGRAGDAGAGAAPEPSGRCGEEGRPCLDWPAEGTFASGFGERDGRHHDGIDITAPRGTPVRAADDGKVLYSGAEIKGYGNMVIVRHEGGLVTVYAHNDENLVSEGDEVERGDEVARVGDTGAATATHLHFEVRVDDGPVDPLLYLPGKEEKR